MKIVAPLTRKAEVEMLVANGAGEFFTGFIPPEWIEWSDIEGRFTPGDLVRHIASSERWMWAENAQGLPSRYPGHGPDLARRRRCVAPHAAPRARVRRFAAGHFQLGQSGR